MTMDQLIEVVSLLCVTFIAYFLIKKKIKNINEYFFVLLVIGLIFIAIGSILVYITFDKETLMDAFLLKIYTVRGRLIFIGYGFVLISIGSLLEKIIFRIR